MRTRNEVSAVDQRDRGRSRRAAGLLAVGLVGGLLLATSPVVATPASAATAPRLQMRWLTNHSRVENGVRRLRLNPRLCRIATEHSRAMAREGSLFHTRNVPRELRPWRWSRWGENVGMTNTSLATLEWAFMNSVDHRRNILDRRFDHVGIGVAHVGGTYWVTVVFYG
jgi:uncharacterized protein YkwD